MYLSEQGKLPKAGALANPSQLILVIIIDCEAALLHHIEHIPCSALMSGWVEGHNASNTDRTDYDCDVMHHDAGTLAIGS